MYLQLKDILALKSLNDRFDPGCAGDVEGEGSEDHLPHQARGAGAVLRDVGGQREGAGECLRVDAKVQHVKKQHSWTDGQTTHFISTYIHTST